MPRPPVKKTRRLAEAKREGELRAELKMHKKKPITESIKEHVGKAIDRVDPLEAVAVLGLTPLVKVVILDPLNGFAKAMSGFTQERASAWDYHLSSFWAFFDITESGLPEWLKSQGKSGLPQGFSFPDWQIWLVSFAVSYLIIKHAGAILQAGVTGIKSLTGLVTMFMPMVVG
jgi:hypothetical protein